MKKKAAYSQNKSTRVPTGLIDCDDKLWRVWIFFPANYYSSRVPEANNVEMSKSLRTISIRFLFGRIYDKREHLNNHFAIIGAWEILQNILQWWTSYFYFYRTKYSINSSTLDTWKYTFSLEDVQPLIWKQITALCFSHTRASQTSDLFVKAIEVFEHVFDKRQSHSCCTYAVIKIAYQQKEELAFRLGKWLAIRLFFWGWEASPVDKLGSTSDLIVNQYPRNELENLRSP